MVFKAVSRLIFAFFLLLFPASSSPAMAQEDPNAQYILLQSGELASEQREIEAPVEVGVFRLQFTLQAGSEIAWTLITPSGKPLVLTDPNISTSNPGSEAGDRRAIAMWDPRPGQWRIRLSGKGRFALSATAQGELFICCIQVWGRNGVYGVDRLQPARGAKQQAQVYASGFNIDTIRFDLINEKGAAIAPLKFRQSDYSNPYNFTLLLETPDQPFRVVARGRDVSGKNFQRVFPQLIRPLPADGLIPRTESSPGIQPFPLPQEWNKATVEGEFKIVRVQVTAWSDAPLLTDKGNPIGIRLKYSIRFPADGSYSPQPQVYPERISSGYTGALGMRVARGSVEPMPDGLQNPGQFFLGARANFKGGTVYHFTVDLVPSYAMFDEQKKAYCLMTKSYRQQGIRERFDREVMSEQRIRYRLSFSGSDLDGRTPTLTENAYVPNAWFQGFVREGVVECQ
jgi:hypothetical protein